MAVKKTRVAASQFPLGYLVHDVARLRRTVVDKALKPLGVTRSQWWVLVNLRRYSEEGMMQTELAKAMDIGKVALGGMLDRLEANGYVERRTDPGDRRAKLLAMTASGEELLIAIEHRAAALNRVMIRGLAPDAIELAADTLQHLKTRLLEMDRGLHDESSAQEDEPRPVY